MNFQKVTLESALRTLRQRYGINLSYSNTALNLRQPVTLHLQNQPLRMVLDRLLRDTNISYQVVGGQVVLHPAVAKPTTATASAATPMASTATPARATEARSATAEPVANKPVSQELSAKPASVPSQAASKPTLRKPTNVRSATTSSKTSATSNPPKRANTPAPSANPTPSASDSNDVTASTAAPTAVLNQPPLQPAVDSVAQPTDVPSLKAEPEETARETVTRPVQVSFLWPLGSNGFKSGRTVNKLSLNVLAGYQAGVDGFEGASLVNVDRYDVKGAQVAGLGNIVGHQLAGFQGAGLLNVLGGEAKGWQAAGLLNLAGGSVQGGQAAGLFNASLGEMRGVQMAGLLNVARSVHGVQLAGLINVADSVDGVSIAPLNFVRHGYHRLEITNSETWPVSAALKLGGSAAFYTFFTGAYDDFGSGPRRWALGYGLGTEFGAHRRVSLGLDAVAMQVNEEQRGWTDQLNLHNQVRVLLGFAPFKAGSHLRIVAGPTVSVLVTERYDTGEQKVYSNLTKGRKLWLNEGTSRTRVVGWFGYSAGVRF